MFLLAILHDKVKVCNPELPLIYTVNQKAIKSILIRRPGFLFVVAVTIDMDAIYALLLEHFCETCLPQISALSNTAEQV